MSSSVFMAIFTICLFPRIARHKTVRLTANWRKLFDSYRRSLAYDFRKWEQSGLSRFDGTAADSRWIGVNRGCELRRQDSATCAGMR